MSHQICWMFDATSFEGVFWLAICFVVSFCPSRHLFRFAETRLHLVISGCPCPDVDFLFNFGLTALGKCLHMRMRPPSRSHGREASTLEWRHLASDLETTFLWEAHLLLSTQSTQTISLQLVYQRSWARNNNNIACCWMATRRQYISEASSPLSPTHCL